MVYLAGKQDLGNDSAASITAVKGEIKVLGVSIHFVEQEGGRKKTKQNKTNRKALCTFISSELEEVSALT